jgi:energy-coupling factor transport system substrate-specific component
MVGAVSGFVSNFYFGQGPWTPWQMFGFGIIGFMAGLFYKFGLIKKTNTSLSVFGFLSVIIIYGGIMNTASVLMIQNKPTLSQIISAYAVGFPFDLIHAVGTVIFLLVVGKTLIEKIERVKVKFGLMDYN